MKYGMLPDGMVLELKALQQFELQGMMSSKEAKEALRRYARRKKPVKKDKQTTREGRKMAKRQPKKETDRLNLEMVIRQGLREIKYAKPERLFFWFSKKQREIPLPSGCPTGLMAKLKSGQVVEYTESTRVYKGERGCQFIVLCNWPDAIFLGEGIHLTDKELKNLRERPILKDAI